MQSANVQTAVPIVKESLAPGTLITPCCALKLSASMSDLLPPVERLLQLLVCSPPAALILGLGRPGQQSNLMAGAEIAKDLGPIPNQAQTLFVLCKTR